MMGTNGAPLQFFCRELFLGFLHLSLLGQDSLHPYLRGPLLLSGPPFITFLLQTL